MNKKRPVNLAMTTMKFPLMAIISILHRLSGVILFLVIPFVLYGLSESLASEESYNKIQKCFTAPVSKVIIWLVLSALSYHLLAGIRHLIMDIGCGEKTATARKTGAVVILFTVLAALLIGDWLW